MKHMPALAKALAFGTTTAAVASLLVAAAPASSAEEVVVAEGSFAVGESHPAPSEATLFAWPANEVLADLEVGEQFALDPVGSVDVGPDGTFMVAVDDADGMSDYASDTGEVNLYLSADNGEAEFGEAFAVDVASLDGATSDGAAVELGQVSEVGDVNLDPEAPDASEAPAFMEKSCTTTKVANLGNKWIPVGGLFSTNAGATVDYQYSSGQSTSLGVATSQSGHNVGFKASGTHAVSSSSTLDFTTLSGKGSKLARTLFRYGNYKTHCRVFHTNGQSFTSTTYTVRPDLWVGGTGFIAASTPSATYCAPYTKGSAFTKDRDKQVTWTGALSVYGVGLSAQTGWSTKGKLAVKFPSAAGKVCGSGGYATQTNAYQIVVK